MSRKKGKFHLYYTICNKLKTLQISVLICPVYINKNYLCVSESRKTKKMEQIDNLKRAYQSGDVDTAIKQLDQLLQDSSVEKEKDTLYYLRGNAYRKKGDWKRALDNYQYAIEINRTVPAVQAWKMVIDILNFYHKDMFNQ